MKKFVLPLLICPACLPKEQGLDCVIESEQEDDILEGTLACSFCGTTYPIRHGVAFLDPAQSVDGIPQNRYESPGVVSSYLWSHFGDLLGDENASDAYLRWAALMQPCQGPCVDIGGAVGRFAFEMAAKCGPTIGLDNSVAFIRTARQLMQKRELVFDLAVEGKISRRVRLALPSNWPTNNLEFIVADALALPFKSQTFAAVASLNLVDKVPLPKNHLEEGNRVAKLKDAQFLFSDPFSWSVDVAREEDWLGGSEKGALAGRGHENVEALLNGGKNSLQPAWKTQEKGRIWWKIRTHENHYELIRSCFVKAAR
ncbi:MAG: methyltransferase domain-containing protein [Desulfatibacillaceae bacterium]|nr:methyltransferase domain-containing protein [Desulfatibacillaceae bacterium]